LVINPANLKLPFWLFTFEELLEVIFAGRPGNDEEIEILTELVPLAKALYQQSRETPIIKRIGGKAADYTVDTPVPYRLKDLLALIDERMGRLENRSSRINHRRLITRIEAVSNDPRYGFMFTQYRRRYHGGNFAPFVQVAARRQADDGDAAGRNSIGSRGCGGVGAVPNRFSMQHVVCHAPRQ
jgi:hypothetical protein